MKEVTTTALIALALLAVPTIASAETAYASAPVNLRTGPDAGYPRIATLPAGTRLEVHGCVSDWSWCDVETRYDRGWVSAAYLAYDDRGRRVGISRHGAEIGLPVLSFVLGTYWDDHYRGKPWYSQRSRWEGHQTTHSGGRPQSSRPGESSKHQQQPGRPSHSQQGNQPGASLPQQQGTKPQQQGTKPQDNPLQSKPAKHSSGHSQDDRHDQADKDRQPPRS